MAEVLVTGVAVVPAGSAAWPEGRDWSRSRRWAGPGAGDLVAAARAAAGMAAAAGTVAEAEAVPSVAAGTLGGPGAAVVVSRGAAACDDVQHELEALAQDELPGPEGLTALLFEELSDFAYLRGLPSLLGQHVCRAIGAQGSHVAVGGEAAAGGLGALVLACRMIADQEAERVMVVAGGGALPAAAVLLEAADAGRGRRVVPLAVVTGWRARTLPPDDAGSGDERKGGDADGGSTGDPGAATGPEEHASDHALCEEHGFPDEAGALIALAERLVSGQVPDEAEHAGPGLLVRLTLRAGGTRGEQTMDRRVPCARASLPSASPDASRSPGRSASATAPVASGRSVVLDGIGCVSPLGATFPATWDALVSGRSGIVPAPAALTGLPAAPALGAIPAEAREAVLRRWAAALDRPVTLTEALAHEVADQALADAGRGDLPGAGPLGLVWAPMWPGPGGSDAVAWGEWFRRLGTPEGRGEDASGPAADRRDHTRFPQELGARLGRAIVPLRVEATCAGGLRAVAEAVRMVRSGAVGEALALGVVARNNPYVISQFAQLTALSRYRGAPCDASRPFAVDRAGMVMAEAAAAVLVRAVDPAETRRRCVISGAGLAADAGHPTAPEPPHMIRAIQAALCQAGVTADEVGTLNSHGTGTPRNDAAEAEALTAVFGPRLARVPLAACKALTGHASSASGVLELAVLERTLRTGIVPGVPTCASPDPALGVDVATGSRLVPAGASRAGLTASFGFGGQYAAVVLTR